MICILQLATLVMGLVTLGRRRIQVTSKSEVRGGPAIVIGLILTAIVPVTLGLGFLWGMREAAQGRQVQIGRIDAEVLLLELGPLAAGIIVSVIIAVATKQPMRRETKRIGDDYDDYDDARRSDRRRRFTDEDRDDGEDDEFDRPRRTRRSERSSDDDEHDRYRSDDDRTPRR